MTETEVRQPEEGLQQAAILLLSMGEEAAANILKQLSREEVSRLTVAMASLPGVKKDQAQSVFLRFFTDFRSESGITGASRGYLERTLDKALGRSLARPLIDSIYGDTLRSSLQRLQWLEPSKLVELIAGEHPQLQAVFLAYLEPDMASQLLSRLPPETHDDLLYRLANLDEIHPDMIDEVHVLLEKFLQQVGHRTSSQVDGTKKAVDILNRMGSRTSEIMLSLRDMDPSLMVKLEESMYQFDILERQSEATLSRMIEEVPQERLALALKGSSTTLQEKIFACLPKRAAQYLREEMETKGAVRMSAVEEARTEIMQTLRQLANDGEVELSLFAENVVE